MEIVILCYLFTISDTLSVAHSFSTVLSHVWGCAMGVLYQKSVERFAVPHSRLQHRCTTTETLPEVTQPEFAAGYMHLEKCYNLQYCPLDVYSQWWRIRPFFLSKESEAIAVRGF